MTRNLSFSLFKPILKKRYACGGLYAADFKIFFVDLVTIWYIGQINGVLQPDVRYRVVDAGI